MTRRLATLAPTLDLVEVGHADSARRLAPAVQRGDEEGAAAWYGSVPPYAWALASSVAITVLATPLLKFFDLANIVMLFLLGTVGVALKFGRGPAALACSAIAPPRPVICTALCPTRFSA